VTDQSKETEIDEALLRETQARLERMPRPERRAPRSVRSTREPRLLELTLRAEAVAAVSGTLEPAALLKSVGVEATGALGRSLLNALAPMFHVEVKTGKTLWSLLPEQRSEILDEVVKRGVPADLPETDEFGTMLRRVLDPNDHLDEAAVSALPPSQLLALVAATETLPDAQIDKPDLDAMYARIARERLVKTNDVLLRNFVGRHDELAQLRAFLEKPLTRDWAGLLVTGLGGSGKSTLVAKFISEVRERKVATVVVLDFDRPGVDPRDAQWLENELARQVAAEHPELEPRLRHAREHAWGQKLLASAEQTHTSEARDANRGRRLLDELRDGLLGLTPEPPALLLVLDTFEEVTQLKLEGLLVDWLVEVGDRLQPLPVKVIISGRIFDIESTLGAADIERALHLDELAPDCAVELLRKEVASSSDGKLEMPEAYALELVEGKLIPLRPLELKLVARLYLDSPDQIDELKRDLRNGGELLKGLFAGLVYRRILARMNGASELVKQLAFPGLVLRYVTPELIREVLVPSLGLPPLEDEAAERAFDILASYSWFAQREPSGQLRYRRDLRRATLKVARAQEAEKTRKIHQEAIAWFSKPKNTAPAEVLYHRLMLVCATNIDADLLEGLNRHAKDVRSDIEDLPELAEALLLFATQEAMRPEQIALLPSPYREEGYRRKGLASANAGEFGLAYAMHERFREGAAAPVEKLEPWEVETLFASAAWPELRGRRPRRLEQPSGWREFVTDVFVGSVLESVGLSDIDDIWVADKVLSGARYGSHDLSRTDRARLAFAFTLGRDRPRRPEWSALLTTIAKAGEDDVGGKGQWASRLLLLRLLRRRRGSWAAALLATPITLDPSRHDDLLAVGQLLAPDLGNKRLREFVASIGDIVTNGVRGRWTARSILSAVNGLAGYAPTCLEGFDVGPDDRRIIAPSNVDPATLFDCLAKVDPELRDPARFALRDAFADSQEDLRQLLSSVVPFTLDDLNPESFARELSADVEHALSAQIELVDRCGKLGELLSRAASVRPKSERLALVMGAHAKWRAALRRLFEINATS
jgi:hypothetical protein